MQKIKFFTLAILALLSANFVWGADSGLQPADGKFIIDFYDSEKLSSTSGTGLTNSNYSNFVKVATGLTKSNVVTSVSVTGTVQYGKNGGLTAGTGTAAGASSHYVTFNIGDDYAVNKVTVYATAYEDGKWQLNGTDASSGSLGAKGTTFSNVTSPLVWSDLDDVTTLTFKKMGTNGGNQKRLTIYTIVCEYTSSPSCTAPTITSDLSEDEVVYTKDATATPLSIMATGTDVTYQWYSNTSKSTTGATTLTDQTLASYTPSTATTGTKYYYCVASSSTCTTTSKFATITVTAPKYTVTFNAGSGTCGTPSSTEGTAGAGVNLPVASPSSACGTDGWTFAGWKETSAQTETTTAPTLYAANSNYKPSSNCTLYAVYSKTESGSGPTKWMVATSIAAGDVVVISTNQNYTAQTMKTAGTISSSLMGCFASTYNSDKSEITSLASGTLQFTIGGNSTSGYTLKNGDNYLGMSGDKKVALSTTSSTWSISFSGSTATLSQGYNTSTYKLQYNYNTGNDRFTGYTSAQVAVSLYKKSSGTTTYNSNPSCAVCSNLITITKGNPSHGSFTLTGAGTDICADAPVTVNLSNITADTHYHATAVTTSATTGGGTPSAITSGGSATVSGITASTTINVTFAEDTKVVVTLLNNNNPVNAGGFDAQGKKEYYTGETLGTLPTLTSSDACDATSVTFMGWTTEQITTKRAAAPSFVTPTTPVTGNMTLRAVWARGE